MNERYFERMRAQLSDFAAYRACLSQPPYRGIRVNTLKISPDAFREIAPFALAPAAWEPNGFLISEEKPGKYFYHDAGLYYVQEPSAMCAVPLLGARPGERVLDLCSAPGGKGTQLAAQMGYDGVIFLNEINFSRGKILSQNVERMGITNAVVTVAPPVKLAAAYPACFDAVLVDAPCSGSGVAGENPDIKLFRREEDIAALAAVQRRLLANCARYVRPGGSLYYSTCSFFGEENDGAVAAFLEGNGGFAPAPLDSPLGCRPARFGLQFLPHLSMGAGFYVAKLTRK